VAAGLAERTHGAIGGAAAALRGVASPRSGWSAARRLLIAGATVALTAVPASAAGPVQLTSINPAAMEAQADRLDSPYARHMAQLINDYRVRNGLAPLVLATDLNALAAEHSSQMAEQRRLSHDGFRGRFDRTSSRVCVENVGVNFPHAEAQLDGWRASPGHHRNLLEPRVAKMGIAQSRSFVTFFACS
jgi:uncharacterized protein YkwD